MKLEKKVCPCCGKPLKLIPPSREFFPDTMGVSINGIEFSLRGECRFSSYDKDPQSEKLNTLRNNFMGRVESTIISDRAVLYISEYYQGQRTRSFPVTPVNFISRKIRKGGIHLYNRWLFFQCEECMGRLALNSNPMRLSGLIDLLMAVWVTVITATGLCVYGGVIAYPWFILSLLVLPLSLAAYCIYIVISLIKLSRTASNFAPIDSHDNFVVLPKLLTVSRCGIAKKHCRVTNILSTDFEGETYHLYITEVSDDSLGLYICGSSSEQQLLLERLGGYSPTLNLRFEGMNAGSAIVTEICTLPENLLPSEADEAPKEWRCSYCRYFNEPRDMQCKSCGRYK